MNLGQSTVKLAANNGVSIWTTPPTKHHHFDSLWLSKPYDKERSMFLIYRREPTGGYTLMDRTVGKFKLIPQVIDNELGLQRLITHLGDSK